MKKVILLVLAIVSIQFTSCKSEAKKDTSNSTAKEEKTAKFSVQKAQNNIDWVAYKTTEKLPVKGAFKKITVTSGGEGNTIKEAIHNTEFNIPVSSIFTNDESRDFKIKKFFFGMMDNTSLLSGKLILEDDTKGYANLTMNGVTKKLPFTYTITDKEFKLSGLLMLADWKGEKALTSLNNECKDLHKGADGISKTWDEVAINISTIF